MNKRLVQKILYYAAVTAIAAGTALGIYFGFVRAPHLPPEPAPPAAGADAQSNGATPAGKDKPKLELRRPEITHMQDGKTVWQFRAGEVETDPETGASVLREVEGQVFGDKERVLFFSAPLTLYDPASGAVQIQGGFRGEVGADTSVQGRDLKWNNEDRRLQVADAKLSVKGASIRGDAMTIMPELETVDFKGNVEIEIELSAPGAPQSRN